MESYEILAEYRNGICSLPDGQENVQSSVIRKGAYFNLSEYEKEVTEDLFATL